MKSLTVDQNEIKTEIQSALQKEFEKYARRVVKENRVSPADVDDILDFQISRRVSERLEHYIDEYEKDNIERIVEDRFKKYAEAFNIDGKIDYLVHKRVVAAIEKTEEAIFQRVMTAKFKHPEKAVAFEFSELMAGCIMKAYEAVPKK